MDPYVVEFESDELEVWVGGPQKEDGERKGKERE